MRARVRTALRMAAVGGAVLAARADAARAAELKVWTARALATVLAELGPQFEKTTGHHLVVTADLSAPFLKRARAGEPFDVLITGAAPLDELIQDGLVVAGTRATVARSGIGVEVRAGAPKPDIRSLPAFKKALLDAKSIAYLKDVGSGIHVARVVESLGLAEAVRSKLTRPDGDVVSEMVARGEVEIGIVVITQILTTPGVELVGPLPPEIQSYVVFTAGVGAHATEPEAAKALVAFLTGPAASSVIEAQGMEAGELPVR
jgi:molybdate transport system substrate-binding protein